MAKILSIESSTNVCSVAIHEDGVLLGTQTYHISNSHSSLLPEIIAQLLKNCHLTIDELNAFAVSIGPGSYTGLRIGVSTVKGLAYPTGKPIIALDTLTILCEQIDREVLPQNSLLCPMIDARRMEVYCLLQNLHGEKVWDTQPLVVEQDSFAQFSGTPIYFFGDGASKCKALLQSEDYHFFDQKFPEANKMGNLALNKFKENNFEDLAYLEPNYLKAFRTNKPAVKFKI